MRKRYALGLALVAGLALAGCGGDDDSGQVAAPVDGGEASAPEPEPGGVADVAMVDLASGQTVSMATTLATDKPTLYWFWAPY